MSGLPAPKLQMVASHRMVSLVRSSYINGGTSSSQIEALSQHRKEIAMFFNQALSLITYHIVGIFSPESSLLKCEKMGVAKVLYTQT